MLDISLGEFVLVLLIAVVFIGPERLPQVARKIGSFMGQLKEAFFSLKEEVAKDEETAQVFSEMQSTVSEIANAVNIKKVVREMGAPLMDSRQEVPVKEAHWDERDNAWEGERIGDEGAVEEEVAVGEGETPSPMEEGEQHDPAEEAAARTGAEGPVFLKPRNTKELQNTFHRVE